MAAEQLIPPRYADVTTTVEAAIRWCDGILAGHHMRLLIIGPHWSGKTHTAYAALRRLLGAGYPAQDIAAYASYDLTREYDPARITHGPPVLFIDDLTHYPDGRHGVTSAAVDEPDLQAVLAVREASLADAARRLTGHTSGSWIACASSRDRLEEAAGADIKDQLLVMADVADLPPRPLPGH